MKDAFGLVSMVALMPLIVIQIVGIIYKYKSMRNQELINSVETSQADDNEIIIFKKKISTK